MRLPFTLSLFALLVGTAAGAHAQESSSAETKPSADADSESEASTPTDGNEESDRPPDEGIEEQEKPSVTSPVEPPISQPDLTEQEARAAFRLGDRLYLEGDYAGAIESFERAYALSGRIEMLFNLANAHERLGNYDRASVALRGYIPHSPAEHRTALERRLERFEQLANKQRQQEVETAEAVKDLKENPRPFPVERGLGIGFVTLGTAGLATGVGFALSAKSARNSLDDSCVEGENGRLCTSDADATLNRDKSHSIVADAAVITGALLIGTGVFFLVRANKKEREKVELRVGLGLRSLQLQGSF